MENQGDQSHGTQISCGNPNRDHLAPDQVGTAQQQSQRGNFADRAWAVAQEHIQNAFFRQCGHNHMVQGCGCCNAVQTFVPGQPHRDNQHQECSGSQCRVKDILSQTAAEHFYHNDGKYAAQSGSPIGNGVGKGHGQQQAGHQGGAVQGGVSAFGDKTPEPFSGNGGGHTDQCNQQRPQAKDADTDDQRRKQGKHHIQHDPVGAKVSPDVRRRSNGQFHFALASLTICLPLRKRSTRGSLPGQVNAQLPHSMQSSICSRVS